MNMGLNQLNGNIGTGRYKSIDKTSLRAEGGAPRELISGKTVSGQVVSVNGNEVEIVVNGEAVNARLESAITLLEGQIMSFEVKGGAGSILSLIPLFENLAHDENVLKALDAAGIPATEKSVRMVLELIKEGMSIDKQSLQSIYKEVLKNPDADLSSIAALARLKIPFTPENIEQYENYANQKHQIANGIREVGAEIANTFELLGTSGDGKAADVCLKMLDIFTSDAESVSGLLKEGTSEIIDASEVIDASEIIDALKVINEAESDNESIDNMPKHTGGANDKPAYEIGHEKEIAGDVRDTKISEILSREEISELLGKMEKSGIPKEIIQTLKSGNLSANEVLNLIKNEIKNASDTFFKDNLEVFSDKGFKKLVEDVVLKKWIFEDGGEVDKQSVEALYKRVRAQTSEIINTMRDALRADSPLMKSAEALRDNVEFMNHLNQAAAYVQIPMKMGGRYANGELCVYTNKRNLAKRDGDITAFLHLNMKNIGALDVHVKMEMLSQGNPKVSTNFYLESKEHLDFLYEHLPELDRRLKDKGYAVSSKAALKESDSNIMEDIKASAGDGAVTTLAHYGFDVRA